MCMARFWVVEGLTNCLVIVILTMHTGSSIFSSNHLENTVMNIILLGKSNN